MNQSKRLRSFFLLTGTLTSRTCGVSRFTHLGIKSEAVLLTNYLNSSDKSLNKFKIVFCAKINAEKHK